MMAEKKCSKCGVMQPISEYFVCRGHLDGRKSQCKKCSRLEKQAYYIKNKSELAARSKIYRTTNKEVVAQRSDRYRKEHLEYFSMKSAESRIKFPEYHKKYMAAHPENKKAWWESRRARELNAPGGGVTKDQWKYILDFYGKKCLKCGSEENITMDHVIPLFVGGHHATYNIQPLCGTCNSSKGTRTIDYRYIQNWT